MDLKTLIPQKLKEKFLSIEFDVSVYRDELTIKFAKKNIVEVCAYLKSDPELEFTLCSDITAVDWATRKNRFTVVYNIFSIRHNFRLRLKSDVDESDCKIDSVSSVWHAANWQERETYDMYGIKFNNHPDLRRMYMPEEFEYHPLRKDFPLMGIPGSLPLPKK
ncbi:MAG: NADH-quinone oxidoreductase subunit C [Ignavibacteria bacterium]|nr:NADH-quinone oxidoreductase subunit C [Ignavibacteria bacterium]